MGDSNGEDTPSTVLYQKLVEETCGAIFLRQNLSQVYASALCGINLRSVWYMKKNDSVTDFKLAKVSLIKFLVQDSSTCVTLL